MEHISNENLHNHHEEEMDVKPDSDEESVRSPRFRNYGTNFNIDVDIDVDNDVQLGFGDIAKSLFKYLSSYTSDEN